MDSKRKHRKRSAGDPKSAAPQRRESGEPGGGQGRRDEVGRSGVYPPTADNIPPDAEIRMAGSWGGGAYDESGGSELVYRDGMLLGGLTAGPDGEPTLDIHAGGGRAPDSSGTEARVDNRDEVTRPAAIDPVELRLRGLPKGSAAESDTQRDTQRDTQGDGTPRGGHRPS